MVIMAPWKFLVLQFGGRRNLSRTFRQNGLAFKRPWLKIAVYEPRIIATWMMTRIRPFEEQRKVSANCQNDWRCCLEKIDSALLHSTHYKHGELASEGRARREAYAPRILMRPRRPRCRRRRFLSSLPVWVLFPLPPSVDMVGTWTLMLDPDQKCGRPNSNQNAKFH